MRVAAWIMLLCGALVGPAQAYNLQTVASDSCHEQLTLEALLTIIETFGGRQFPVPDDDVLRRLLDDFSTNLLDGSVDLSESDQFIVFSTVVGVRSPDTEGHSTLDLSALRRLHADPEPAGQYAHALRGPDDDGVAGDIAAVDGTIGIIQDQLVLGFTSSPQSGNSAVEKRDLYIEHYGTVSVSVFLPAYYLGRAIHALQDAHAHMVWNDEITHVVHVLNYIDAVNGVRKTSRDGMAHSSALDDCHRDDTQPMVRKATMRTGALTLATLALAESGNPVPLQVGLSPCLPDAPNTITCGWLVYKPDCRAAVESGMAAAIDAACCTAANDYCGSTFATIAKKEPAGPYLGCQSSPGGGGLLVWALVLLGALRRRGAPVGLLLLLLVFAPQPAAAEPPRAFAAAEGHGSFLNDTPNSALLDVTFGYAARFGYRWGRWRAVLHVEQNAFLGLEFGADLRAGTLNIGAGAEALFFDDFVRVGFTAGPSVLLYDTQLDKAGSKGLFTELRPIGFRFPVYDGIIITFDPITFAVVAPVLRDPPLRKLERRTHVGVEFGFF